MAIMVEFYDERGNRLYHEERESTPKVGEILDIPVVREGILRLVVTVVVSEGTVIVEPPDMSN